MGKLSFLSTSRGSIIVLAALVAAALFGTGAFLRTATAVNPRYVATTGTDAGPNDCLTEPSPCLTIGHAIGQAAPGDTIDVAAGTYDEAVDLNKAGLTLVGAGAGSTTIDYMDFGYNGAGMYVQADDVTVQDLTLTQSTVNSTPRYGLKVGISDGVTIDGVTVSNSYRTGLDVLGASNITIDGVTLANNGGHGTQLLDVNGASVNDVTISGSGWNDISVATWGQNSPLGTSGVVISGTNSFGGNPTDNGGLQLEEGNSAVPANPQSISWSTLPADVADVTIQPSDFGYALSGPSDDGQPRTKFYDTLANAQNGAAGSPSHIQPYDRFLRTTNGLAEQTNYYVYDLVGDKMSIQAAIDAASGGDMVKVEPGTYPEQVTIGKSLTLTGDTSGSCPGPGVNAPVIDGGGAVGSAITIAGGVSNVTIEGFEITNHRNRTLGSTWTTGGIGSGVLAWSSTAISNVTVRDNSMHDLGWSAVLVGNEGQALHDNWLVECNEVADVAAYAIELTNTANSSVIDNEVTGGEDILGEPDDSEDGILIQTQIHTGAGLTNTTITVDGNTVSGPLTRAGIEVLAWDSTDSLTAVLDDVTVSSNTVTGGTTRGALAYTVGANATIDNLSIDGNVLDGNFHGVQVSDWVGTHGSIDITGNDILNSTGTSSGVKVTAGTSATGIAVNYNNIVGNALLGINHEGTGTLDAEKNWWGDATGADHDSSPHGVGAAGDAVSDNVDFVPWYATSTTTPGTEHVSVTDNPLIAYSDTIQGGIDAATDGDTLVVSAGTYTENVSVNKDVTLAGLNPPDGGSAAVVDGTVDLTADGATVQSLKVVPGSVGAGDERAIAVYAGNTTVTGNLIDGMTGDGEGSISGVGIFGGNEDALLNISVTYNVIKNIDNQQPVLYGGATGIQVQGNVDGVDVTGNTVEDIHSAGWAFGIEVTPTGNNPSFNPPQNVLVQQNRISIVNDGSVYVVSQIAPPFIGVGLGLDETFPGADDGDASQVTITNNSFGTIVPLTVPLAILNKDTDQVLDASANWLSSNDPATVATRVYGLVDYTPWLDVGTDVGGDPSDGFQGDFSVLHVDDDSPQSDATGHVQEGIDLVSGSTVNVEAGTYNEDVDLNQAGLTLVGAGAASTTIDYVGQSGHNNAGMYVQADNVTVQDLTLTQSIVNSTPRYGLKVGISDGVTIDGVTVNNSYGTGLDVLGASNITIDGVTLTNNGGHGMQLLDVNGASVNDVTISGSGWNDMSVATWGHYSPLGTSGVVISGTNSFGGNPTDNGGLQLEEGNWLVPANPESISWSTLLADGADVTIQPSDFGYALSGPSDDGQPRTKFYDTLTNARNAAAGSPSHILSNDRFLRTTNGLAEQTNYYVYDLAGDKMSIQAAIDAASAGDTINVAAGTYDESLDISESLDVVGAGSDQVFVTGGIVITGTFDGLLLEGMHLSGDGPGPKNAVIDSRPTTAPGVSGITLRDNVLDGENTSGRGAFYGHFITGAWTWDGNEIKNFPTWYVIDNTGSSHDVPYKLAEIVFTDNHVHDVGGSIAFRGKIDEPMDLATISGNTFEDYPASVDSQVWAAIEISNVQDLRVYENTFTGVPEVQWGDEGQALQIWSASPWTVDIHNNEITDNHMGIYIWAFLPDALWSGPDTNLYVPGGSVSYNSISGNAEFGVWISDLPAGSATSSAIGGPLNAEENWWGACDGPSGVGPGTGDAVSANVDYDPWEARQCDKDGDLLTNDAENDIHGTDPLDPDTDDDGCVDGAELLFLEPALGGQRDPLYYWDFYDTPDASNVRNRSIDMFGDVFGVAGRFGATGNPSSDPLAGPIPPAPAYHAAFDRGELVGPNPWDLGPADGSIDLFIDIFGVAAQFGHDCRALP